MSVPRPGIARFLFPSQANSPPNVSQTNSPSNVSETVVPTTSPLIIPNTPSSTSVPVSPSNENNVEEEHSGGVDEAEMDSTPNSNGSPLSVDPKIYVGIAGKNVRDFEPRPEAFLKMTEIVRSHYTGPWTSVAKVPDTTKDLWFQEFQKMFYWTISDYEMRKVFLQQAALHIRNVFKSCRKRGKRPNFITKRQWEAAEAFRKTNPAMVKQAAANKRNRSNRNAIKSGFYRGGSRKLTMWIKVLEKQNGTKPTISDVVRKLWQKEDGTWTGEKPASIVEKFDSLVLSQAKENDSGEPIVSLTEQEENELWVQACDGPQNGRIFALGEQGTAMIRTKTFSCSLSQTPQISQAFQENIVQPFKEEIQELRATVLDLVKQQQVQQQQHLDFQALILQQLLKLQGNSTLVSNS